MIVSISMCKIFRQNLRLKQPNRHKTGMADNFYDISSFHGQSRHFGNARV